MPITRATVSLNKTTGLPEDAVVNVWHFSHLDALDFAMGQRLASGIELFYNHIFSYYASTMARAVGSSTISLAVLNEGAPGVADDIVSKIVASFATPQAIAFPPFSTVPGAENLPAEVACCLSFRGDITGAVEELGATRPANRRRGRVFLGCLSTAGFSTETEPRVNAAFREAILDAYDDMKAYLLGPTYVFQHGVYSPTNGSTMIVVQTSVDDAVDIIRSRGVSKSLRQTRDVVWSV